MSEFVGPRRQPSADNGRQYAYRSRSDPAEASLLATAQQLSRGVSLDLDAAAHVLAKRQHIIVRQRVVHELAVTPSSHERRVVQRLQVLRQRALQQSRRIDQVGDSPFTGLELVEDAEPRRIGQHTEPPRHQSEELGSRGRFRTGGRPRGCRHDRQSNRAP